MIFLKGLQMGTIYSVELIDFGNMERDGRYEGFTEGQFLGKIVLSVSLM